MQYCQKSVFGLTINDGKLAVEILDSDGGIHPPVVIEADGEPGEGVVYFVPAETLPSLEIDDAENLTHYMN